MEECFIIAIRSFGYNLMFAIGLQSQKGKLGLCINIMQMSFFFSCGFSSLRSFNYGAPIRSVIVIVLSNTVGAKAQNLCTKLTHIW